MTAAGEDRNGVVDSRIAPVVIKLGGRALEATAPAALAAELAPLSGRVLLVHGGGAEVSAWCRRAGLEPRFADGLRVTDAATLEIAVAVLAGLANKRLVAGLAANGAPAIGVSAADGGIAQVVLHEDARLGRVGRILKLNAEPLRALLAAGFMPVLASIGADGETLLNLNADDLAGAVAAALGSPALVLLSDTPGVAIDGAFVLASSRPTNWRRSWLVKTSPAACCPSSRPRAPRWPAVCSA